MSEEEKCECSCDCAGKEDEMVMTTEDIANHADDKIDALLQLLIEKKVISEDEYDKAFKSLFVDEEEKEEKKEE